MKAVIILRFLFTSILVLAFFSSSYGLALGGNAALNNSMYAMMFLMLSMGENLFHKVTFLVTFLLIGFAANNRKLLITS